MKDEEERLAKSLEKALLKDPRFLEEIVRRIESDVIVSERSPTSPGAQ